MSVVEQLDQIDWITFGVLILLNVILWKQQSNSCLFHFFLVSLLGIVLPLLSAGREIDRNIAINGPAMDNFELLYTYGIFPVYWLVLVLQLIILALKPKA